MVASMRVRPRDLCHGLLAALDASDGRRRRRQRDTSPDAIGFRVKRDLLEAAIRDDPDPDAFEAWLIERCVAAQDAVSTGAVRAIARDVLAEWRLAESSPNFARWLAAGAPSADRID
jgi:hypothetical protein